MTNPLQASSAGGNPFETPRPRRIRMTQGILRVIVAMQCFGYAAGRLHHQVPDRLCELMLQGPAWPADQVARISDFVAYGLIVCGVTTLLRPSLPILLSLTAYAAGTAMAISQGAEGQLDKFAPALLATQSITPLALVLVDFWPPRVKPSLPMCLAATLLLKLAVVVALLAHGILCCEQALQGGPLWEMLQDAAQQTLRRQLPEENLRLFLAVWGGVEIGFALALLASRSRLAMAGCVIIGSLMALLPTMAHGEKGYHESLAMISLLGAPLALLIFHLTSVREQPPVYLPEIHRSGASSPGMPERK